MKKLLEAIKNPESVKVTANERLVLKLVKHVELEINFIIKQSMYLAKKDSEYGADIARTNLVHRMANMVRKRMKGKINGVSRFRQAKLYVDVAQQLYWLDQAKEEPLIAESKSWGFNDEIKYIVRPRFITMDLENRPKDEELKLPLFRKCRDTLYRPGHKMGKAWDEFSRNLARIDLMITKYSADVLLQLYMRSSDYLDTERKESQSERYIRAKAAAEYIANEVAGKAISLVPNPDSRSRVAKYHYYFSDTKKELDVNHTWLINFYGEAWQTALFEYYDRYELTAEGMEDLRVAMARQWRKSNGHGRTSWKKANTIFAKHRDEILAHCAKDYDHGMYFPRMAKLYKAGIGTMTGFMIEADLSASGIGTAAMCIGSKKMAGAVALDGKATPADAHRSIVDRILSEVVTDEVKTTLFNTQYKLLKKKNTEVTHAQSVDVTAVAWNKLLDSFGVSHDEVTSELVRRVYDEEMPGMLEWIESITSLTEVGVRKGHPVLYFFAPDGVRCATSAFTESRIFQSVSVDKDLKSKTMKFQMRMPIEVENKRIVWKSYEHDGDTIKNKMMGAWANFIQAEDAYGMRFISKKFLAEHNYVPIVKHDGYHVRLGDVKSLTTITYEWRLYQLNDKPIKKYFDSISEFLNIPKIELPDYGMKPSDMKYKDVGEAPFMMT